MIEQAESLITILTIVLVEMIVVLFILKGTYLIIKVRSKKKPKENSNDIKVKEKSAEDKKNSTTTIYNKQSIFDFMEFDSITDDMIVQKNGKRFLMVSEYQGINYDLMFDMEKVAVEESFLQFLNTLTHPIQLYIQTRSINMQNSLQTYQKKIKEIEKVLDGMQREYNQKLSSGNYTKKQLDKEFYDLVRQRNLYEYGKDIILNTEKMNLNKNVLNKKYYIVVSYYPEELSNNNKFDQNEIRSIAFSELYTRTQSMIRTLSACGIKGKILNSDELVDLLYTAYNRDEAEVYGIDKAIKAGYDELFSTAPDVLDKKMKALNEEIEKRAIIEANERIVNATEKEMQINRMVDDMESLILEEVKDLLEKNKRYIGEDAADIALEDLEKELEKGADENVKKEKEKSARG